MQVVAQLLNLPERIDVQLDKLISTTINYLLLAQGQQDVETRLLAEEILVSVVKSVPGNMTRTGNYCDHPSTCYT
jgi:hypothetical protein